ncbi:MAG TPA: LysR family transcriptional regulator [Myxococcota bacterium]|nr:LysR family transcriptional regulator [Myxococcota bacterium]
MELRHLRYFAAVAEERHVTRAARKLGIQQPPLSQQLKALEREVGAPLFVRRPRGVELTAPGRAFYAEARAILSQVDHAVARARRTARGEEGRISVGFTSSAPFHPFVPRVLRAFRESHPRVSLALEESGTPDLIEGVRGERLDAAFIRTALSNTEDLAVEPLFDEPMLVALPKRHALARVRGERDAPVRLGSLAAETFILYRRGTGPGLYDAILAACLGAGFSPHIVQEAPRIVSSLNLVATGLGISLVPECLSRMNLDGVVYRRQRARPPLRAPLLVASRPGDASPALARFLELARRAAREHRH